MNGFINDPNIRSWVGEGKEPLDATLILGNPKNVVLTSDKGMVAWLWIAHGLYECQPHVTIDGRGEWALDFCRRCAAYMVLGHDLWEAIGGIPKNNLASTAIARALGMIKEFERPGISALGGKISEVAYYRMTLQDWVIKYGKFYEPGGREILTELRAMTGADLEIDDNACRYVGITHAMFRGGKAVKAVTFYNRWAYVTRHPQMRLISVTPRLKIALGSVVIDLTTGRPEIDNAISG